MKVLDCIHGTVVTHEKVDMKHAEGGHRDSPYDDPSDGHYFDDPTHPQNQEDDEEHRANMHGARGPHSTVPVLPVAGSADKANAYEGVVVT